MEWLRHQAGSKESTMRKQNRSSARAMRSSVRANRRPKPRFTLPELLENRTLLSTYVVNTTADPATETPGILSLREAIQAVDADSSPDVIDFNITGSGMQTLSLTSALPTLTNSVLIDGTSQPGYAGSPTIEINGGGNGFAGLEFDAGASGSTLQGLLIDGFTTGVILSGNSNLVQNNVISGNSLSGIYVPGNGNTIAGNLIGTDSTGMNYDPNGSNAGAFSAGVWVDGGTGNLIGGSTSATRNIITGNDQDGVAFTSSAGPNTVEGNYIGLASDGKTALGNNDFGVDLGSFNSLAVSDVSVANNVISGNAIDGIYLNTATGNTITGNLIGTDANGNESFDAFGNPLQGNFGDGITIDLGSFGNTIGGTTAAQRNVISGNYANGITVASGAATVSNETPNVISGNYIGSDATGLVANGNFGDGIRVVSGPVSVTGNVLSANFGNGLTLNGGGATAYANRIGVGSDGATKLFNSGDGVSISSSGNIIGSDTAGQGNVIADNGDNGVNVVRGVSNAIEGNSIFGNGLLGIDLGNNGVTPNHAGFLSGPNDFQNYPVLDSAVVSGSQVTISGTFNATANGTFTLDFYANSATDPSGFGQGQTFVGSTVVSTDVNGNASFTATFNVVANQGIWSATATDEALNNTSEFSADVTQTVQTGSTQIQSITALASSEDPSSFGDSVTFTATVTGGAATPTGDVTFFDGSTPLATVALDNSGIADEAMFTTSLLGVATHHITASYAGDSNYLASNSPVVAQVVNPALTQDILSGPASSSFGQSVVLQATITPSMINGVMPTGMVFFWDGMTELGSAPLGANDIAFLSTSSLAVGNHNIRAIYAGDANFSGSTSAPLGVMINSIATTTSLAASANPAIYTQTIALQATVASTVSDGAPTGTVAFWEGTTELAIVNLGVNDVAILNVTPSAVGSYTITAVYSGDNEFAGSASAPLTETVNPIPTSTALSSSINPATFGQTIAFQATVASTISGQTPTGMVAFWDGANELGTVSLDSSGDAVFDTSSLAVSNHGITAVYLGATDFAASASSPLTETINPIATTTALSSSINPATFGQTIAFQATVAPTISGQTPTGMVAFWDGTNELGTVSLNSSGNAVFDTSSLAVGNHGITAVYLGASDFATSSSSSLTETINPIPTTTALSSSVNPATFGQMIALQATVASTISGQTPTGMVAFWDGTNELGTVSLNSSGNAVFDTSSLAIGNHNITAVYSGATDFVASTSSPLSETINPAIVQTTTTLNSSVNPSVWGQSVTFTATIANQSGSVNPTGSVTFMDGSTTLGTVNINPSDVATLTLSSLAVGGNSITATYGGDANHDGSSASLNQTVNKDKTATTVTSSSSTVSSIQPVTFTATVVLADVGSGTPTGTVTFTDGTTVLGTGTLNPSGVATLTVPYLAAGAHGIVATYSGDGHFLSSFNATPLAQPVTGSILLLNPTASGSLRDSGGKVIVGGTIYVDSSSSTAVSLSGSAYVQANAIDITGGDTTSGGSKLVGTVQTHQSPVADPFASLPVPTTAGMTTYSAVNLSGTQTATLNPGVYVGGINISGSAKATLNPGIYYIKGGGLTVSGSGSITDLGKGVLIYNAPSGNNGGFTFSGSGSVNLSPMSTGVWAGITLFQQRGATPTVTVSGSGVMDITGAIYATGAAMNISGSAGVEVDGVPQDTCGTTVIVDDLDISGSGSLVV